MRPCEIRRTNQGRTKQDSGFAEEYFGSEGKHYQPMVWAERYRKADFLSSAMCGSKGALDLGSRSGSL